MVKITGERIIAEILRNLEVGAEPLREQVLVPSVFSVYLPKADHERLSVIFPELKKEALQALDDTLARLNGGGSGWWEKWRKQLAGKGKPFSWLAPKRPAKPYRAGSNAGWQVAFLAWSKNEIEAFAALNDGLSQRHFVVVSQLDLPRRKNMAGNKTKLTMTASGGSSMSATGNPTPQNNLARSVVVDSSPQVKKDPLAQTLRAQPAAQTRLAQAARTQPETPSAPPEAGVLATLSYESEGQPRTFQMTKPNIKIGRGGAGYLVALELNGSNQISREHLRLRYDEAQRKFFLTDLSTYGTTINGRLAPTNGAETELPSRARISLASEVMIDFEAAI